jgi:flagellar basal-body rod protein FlgC
MFDVLDMGAAGLVAQRVRMDTIAGNILNAGTTRNAAGELQPYRRRFAILASGAAGNPEKPGVHVAKIEQDRSPFHKKFDPGHPDAGPDGYVQYPNIDLAVEYVNALEASRAYEAVISMMDVSKAMFNSALRLIA